MDLVLSYTTLQFASSHLRTSLPSDCLSPSLLPHACTWVWPLLPKRAEMRLSHTTWQDLAKSWRRHKGVLAGTLVYIHTHTPLTGQPSMFAPTSQDTNNRQPAPPLRRRGPTAPPSSSETLLGTKQCGPSSEFWISPPRGSSFNNLTINYSNLFPLFPEL